jgi:SAM-dependent methyltransferase
MHPQALAYFAAHLPPDTNTVLDFGSRNINGTVRTLVPLATRYVGVDIADGAGVDILGDAGRVRVKGRFDVVVCAEVFEHAPDVECVAMVNNAFRHLRKGGTFIATMAGPGRAPHSAVDGAELHDGEFYRNVTAGLLDGWLHSAGFTDVKVDEAGADLRCVAVK